MKNKMAKIKEKRKRRRYVWMDLKDYTINTQNRVKKLFFFFSLQYFHQFSMHVQAAEYHEYEGNNY